MLAISILTSGMIKLRQFKWLVQRAQLVISRRGIYTDNRQDSLPGNYLYNNSLLFYSIF